MTSGLKFNHGFNGMKTYAKIPSEQSFMPGSFGPPSGLPIKPPRGSQYGLSIKPPRGYSGHLESLFNKHFSYKKNKNSSARIDENQESEMPKQKINESVKQPMLQIPKPQIGIHVGKKPFKCIFCDTSYATKKDLNEHKVKTHEIVMPYNCGTCNLGFFRKQELFEHVSSSHEGKGAEIYQTSKETKSEKSQKDLKKETIACRKGKFLVGCAMCGKNFSEAIKLAEHIESVHKGKQR